MTPNLILLLQPLRRDHGPVAPFSQSTVIKWRQAVHKEAKVPQKRNALRHSYGSYHLEHFKDVVRLMDNLGHEDLKTLNDHYRSKNIPEGSGADYFAIGMPTKIMDISEARTA